MRWKCHAKIQQAFHLSLNLWIDSIMALTNHSFRIHISSLYVCESLIGYTIDDDLRPQGNYKRTKLQATQSIYLGLSPQALWCIGEVHTHLVTSILIFTFIDMSYNYINGHLYMHTHIHTFNIHPLLHTSGNNVGAKWRKLCKLTLDISSFTILRQLFSCTTEGLYILLIYFIHELRKKKNLTKCAKCKH